MTTITANRISTSEWLWCSRNTRSADMPVHVRRDPLGSSLRPDIEALHIQPKGPDDILDGRDH